jgi:hypothetical protein
MAGDVRLSSELAGLAAQVLAGGSISADDVLTLRQGVYKDGVVDRDEADLMFYLDANSSGNDAAWNTLFVESLNDYFVDAQYPPGVLSKEDGEYLVERVSHDGKIDHKTEFELLLSIVEEAKSVPDSMVVLLLQAVRDQVLKGGGVLFGAKRRRKGIIDEADVDMVRKILYGTGGGGFTISRGEADLLFDLNNATVEKENAASWRDLFVTAVGSFLMFSRGPQVVIDADEYARREEWLAQRGGRFAILVSAVKGAASADVMAEAAKHFDRPGPAATEADATAQARRQEAEARTKVDAAEAAWLIERISEDDVLHDNERALFASVKETASHVDPSLDPWFEKFGL